MAAILIHDTHRVIDITPEACALLGCKPEDMIDTDVKNGALGDEVRGLMGLRFSALRARGYAPPAVLPLQRPDGSRFWAAVDTQINERGLYETAIIYIRELKPGERVDG